MPKASSIFEVRYALLRLGCSAYVKVNISHKKTATEFANLTDASEYHRVYEVKHALLFMLFLSLLRRFHYLIISRIVCKVNQQKCSERG